MATLIRPGYRRAFFLCIEIFSLLAILSFPYNILAAQITVDSYTVAVSETDFARRIYSYDMGLDSSGNIHIVYSKPFGTDASEIYYVTRINGAWNEVLLSSDGFLDNKSTFLLIDDNDLIHVCYIKKGTPESLYYRTINNGVASNEIYVDDGGWHSRMQLDANGYPMFVRGGQNGTSKLVLLKTQDGNTWTETFLNLPAVPKFRIADFLYANGTYHITYGGSEYTKLVVEKGNPSIFHNGVFHNQHYATSQDGLQWNYHLLDESKTWYELEFWHSIVLDRGNPVVTMYKYDQYNDIYNRGTSLLLSKWDGASSSWIQSIITDTTYPDTSEGMGVGMAVVGPDDYFAAWDFSPDDTHDPFIRGPRGNIIMARSRPSDYWEPRVQLDPFSLEGRVRLLTDGNHLFFLALGDYVEPRLYFREIDIADFGKNGSNNILDLILPALIHRTKKQ